MIGRPLRAAALLLATLAALDARTASAETAPEDELAQVEAAEAATLGDPALAIERTLLRLGPAHPLAARVRGALGPPMGAWPTPLEAGAQPVRPAPAGELPFAIEAVAGKYDIPVEYNEAVAEYVAFFTGPGRRWFSVWLERGERYVPLFRTILREHGVPEDLVYLAMIESGFSTGARSWASAVGPWQFIEATGERYGLKSDFWVDERQDPVKATHAAARFLKRLHDVYGDWYLAWAGYNAGPGRVNRALEKHATADFWELAATADAFRKETRHYVPKLIAAALISKHPEHFGFERPEEQPPLEWAEVEIPDATDLQVIARCAGVDVEELERLNPELRRWATPPVFPGEAPYRLRLPKGTEERFAERFADVDPKKRFTYRSYVIQPGDTLGHVALMFDTTVEAVKRSNGIRNARALRIGQELVIPVPPGAAPRGASVRARTVASRPRQPASAGTWHTLQAGETLGHVALRYGVGVEKLKRMNGIRDARRVRAGQRLRVR